MPLLPKRHCEASWALLMLVIAMSCGLVSPGSVFVTVAQSAKCKVCCLWHNVFHFDGSMRDEHFFNLSVSSPFFFLDIYFFNNGCAVLLFFHRRSNAVRVGNLGTRTFDEICPAEICGYFYKKVSACHLQFSEYFKIKCYHTCRGLYSFVLPLSSPKKTRTDAIQTLFTGWMCVPHSPPMARPVN